MTKRMGILLGTLADLKKRLLKTFSYQFYDPDEFRAKRYGNSL